MAIKFVLSGSIIAESPSSCVPSVGDEVIIVMNTYKKGMEAGTRLMFTVSSEFPPCYDYSLGDEPEITIDVDNFTILNETEAYTAE